MQLFKRYFFGSGITTLTISHEKIDNIMKIVKSLEESGLSIKGVNKTMKKQKNKKVSFVACYYIHYVLAY